MICAGCGGGAPDEYYRLGAVSSGSIHRAGGISVGLGPISLPSYIDRPELVYQSAPNRFEIPANVRWIGPLHDNLTRVLADDLGRALSSGNILIYPWPTGSPPTYNVAADIRQFHGVSGGDAILEVSWRVEAGGRLVSRHNDTFQEPIVGDGYQAVVEAEDRLIQKFARGIAQSLGRG